MEITYRVDKDILYVSASGRIDASNAPEAEEQIARIKDENQGKHTVIDADKLEYVSSAGLRVILKLLKEEPKLAIINVSPEVYDVLDMTGFTDMITVEKAYRRISIEGCEFIAKGANGAVYRYDDETIVKTYFAKDALPEIKQERENARRAFILGVNTAIPYGIVRVGDSYGTVTELLRASSMTKMIRQNPDDLSESAEHYIRLLRSIHAVEAEDGEFPDMRETALDWADFVAEHIAQKEARKLRALIEAVPKKNTLLHGDYHTNNIKLQDGKPLIIDLDTLCLGHPIFELGSMYNAFVGYAELDHSIAENFFGFSYETAVRFWKTVLRLYLGTDDEQRFCEVEEKAMVVGYTRMLRRAIRRPEDPHSPEMIAHCKKVLAGLVRKVDTLEF